MSDSPEDEAHRGVEEKSTMKEHLYILSIAAVSTTHPSKTNVGLLTRGAFAPTLDEAKRLGKVTAHDLLPESEGWTGHHVVVKMVDRETLARALRGANDDENGEEEERADLIICPPQLAVAA